MTRAVAAGGAVAAVLVVLALAAGHRALERNLDTAAATSPAVGPSNPAAVTAAAEEADPGFLYGRVATAGGATYEGRLRFGGDEEAFWGDYFNGFKDENPWAAHAPPERLKERRPIEVLGVEIGRRERQIDLGRPFMARFGDIARIEARGADVRVTLKSGTVFDLDRLEAGDFDDGVRVWDGERGVVDLDSGIEDLGPRRIQTIELLPAATRAGRRLAGRLVYDLDESETTETLDAPSQGVDYTIPFGLVASIAVATRDDGGARRARVTLRSGEELRLERSGDIGQGNAGLLVFVDGRHRPEYVPWTEVEQVDFDRPPAMYPPLVESPSLDAERARVAPGG